MCARIFAAAASLFCFVASSLILIRITIYCATLAAGVARSRCFCSCCCCRACFFLLFSRFFSINLLLLLLLLIFPASCATAVFLLVIFHACLLPLSFARFIFHKFASFLFAFYFLLVLFLFLFWHFYLLAKLRICCCCFYFFDCPLLLFYCCYFPRWPTASLASLIFSASSSYTFCWLVCHLLIHQYAPVITALFHCCSIFYS